MFKVGDRAVFINSKENRSDLEDDLINSTVEIVGIRSTKSRLAKYLFDCVLIHNGMDIGEYYDYRFKRIVTKLNKQIQVL